MKERARIPRKARRKPRRGEEEDAKKKMEGK